MNLFRMSSCLEKNPKTACCLLNNSTAHIGDVAPVHREFQQRLKDLKNAFLAISEAS